MDTPILTERLLLRPFTLDDAASAHAWLSDEEVMRHIPGGRDHSLEQTQNRIRRYLQHGGEHGFTKWLVTDRTTGELMGDGGLYTLPNDPRVELGFRFARQHWGQGYASEMAQAWMAQFHILLPGVTLYGIVLPDHLRSQRVLEKLGFQPVAEEVLYGRPMKVYQYLQPAAPCSWDPTGLLAV
jgi:RimJ/RimL family protein N-acetyltransferase